MNIKYVIIYEEGFINKEGRFVKNFGEELLYDSILTATMALEYFKNNFKNGKTTPTITFYYKEDLC